jgi:hypothetical protein
MNGRPLQSAKALCDLTASANQRSCVAEALYEGLNFIVMGVRHRHNVLRPAAGRLPPAALGASYDCP